MEAAVQGGTATAPATPSVDTSPPSSMDAALDAHFDAQETGASAPPDPGPSTTPATEPVPATAAPPEPVTPPADQTVQQQTEKKAGVPPQSEWPRILDNARTKVRDETIAQVRQEIGPHLEVVHRLRQDFTGTLEQMITEGLDHPQFGPPLVAMLARHLAARRGKGQAPAVVDEEPQPDLQSQDGEPLYSARQQAKRETWLKQQIAAEQDQKIAPLLQTHQRQEAVQQAKAYLDQRVEDAKPTAQEWEKQPHFTEHKAEILARQASLAKQGHEPWSALGIAYSQVVNAKVLPSLQTKQTTQWQEIAAAKSRGSTPDPASSAPIQPSKARSVDDALDSFFASRAG